MKRLIYLLLAVSLALPATAQSYIGFNGIVPESSEGTDPKVSITGIANGKRVTIVFPGAKIRSDRQFNGTQRLFIPGCAEESHAGMPAVLYYKETFDLKQGSQPEIRNVTTEYSTLNLRLAPAETPQPESAKKSIERRAIANPGLQYPAGEYVLDFDGRYFDRDLYTLKVNVIKYINDSTVNALKSIQFDIVESETLTTEALAYSKMSKLSRGSKASGATREQLRSFSTAIDPAPVDTMVESGVMSPDNSDYIIVTHNSLEEGLKDFVEWKRSTGHNVKVFSNDSWTPDEIRTTISDFCADQFHSSFQYLLIVGDISKVPSNYHTVELPRAIHNYYTDMPYACINGSDDNVPDLFYGRIPSSSCEQTIAVLNKIIDYEKNPPLDNDFYNTVTNVAYFQDRVDPNNPYNYNIVSDGYEDRFFVEGSEEMRNFAISKGKTVNKIYNADADVNPLYWGAYGNGGNIPSDLLRPNFQWNGSCGDVINKINAGSMYVMYRGHGANNGWWNILFGTPHINYLTNRDKQPFLFSITCLTGSFQFDDCLASNFMLSEHNGGIGSIGASETSYSGYNDALSSALIYSIFAEKQTDSRCFTFKPSSIYFYGNPESRYAMGRVLAYAKRSMSRYSDDSKFIGYQNEIFHLFGDPGMMLYTQKPDTIRSGEVLVAWSKDEIRVSAPQTSYISFYNTKTQTVQRYYDTSHKFYRKNLNLDDYIICVKEYNHVPYVIKPYQEPVIIGPVIPVPDPPISSELNSFAPDQSGQNAEVGYTVSPEANQANIQITSVFGEIKKIVTLDKSSTKASIDISGLAKGQYVVNLIVDGVNCGNRNIKL